MQAKPKLAVASKYALAELTPPKLSDIPAIRQGKVQSRFLHRRFNVTCIRMLIPYYLFAQQEFRN